MVQIGAFFAIRVGSHRQKQKADLGRMVRTTGRAVNMGPTRVDAEYEIEFLQERPEAGLCCEGGHWWVTPNANETDKQALLLDATEAERLKDDARLRSVAGIAHTGRLLWVVRRMT